MSTEAPKEAATPEDSAADSTSHHNDIKEEEGGESGDKAAAEGAEAAAAAPAGPVSGLNRLKTRPRLNALHKTDAAKPKAAAAAPAPAPAPRKINPLLAKRRLHLAGATSTTGRDTEELLPSSQTSHLHSHFWTEAPAEEEHSGSDNSGEQAAKEEATGSEESAAGGEAAGKQEQDTTEAAESTTKQQARGLGLLGQRRRLPLRKPGTIL